jgi:hypothetical protein
MKGKGVFSCAERSGGSDTTAQENHFQNRQKVKRKLMQWLC